MTSQQQDLVFFSDNSIISDKSFAPGNNAIHIISHKEATSPSWLLTSIVENGLLGTANLVNREFHTKIANRSLVTVASFVHPKDFWVLLCRKQGVDIETSSNFSYVDCFSDLFTNQVPNPKSPETGVARLFSNITSSISKQKHEKRVVILESPELLLAATDLSTNALISHIRQVAAQCSVLFVVINTAAPLINFTGTQSGDPVTRITDFYVKLHHMSSLNINILPLATGRAKDITGCLTVARGALPAAPELQVVGKEYIYHITKENVKLFFR